MTLSLCNLRDVGGLPLSGGGVVAGGILYRGDAPVAGDLPPDVQPWPPATVVDLRSSEERARLRAPDPWPTSVRVIEVPLFSELDPTVLAFNARHRPITDVLTAMFDDAITKHPEPLVRTVAIIATAATPVLVHCAAGKDRTSLAVALTLDAIGADTEAVLADHLRTNRVIGDLTVRLARGLGRDRLDADLPHADGPSLRGALRRWQAHDGGSAGWLLAHGLDPDVLASLRSRLVSA